MAMPVYLVADNGDGRREREDYEADGHPDAGKGRIRVEATADGPSCWRLERLEEAITVSPSHARKN